MTKLRRDHIDTLVRLLKMVDRDYQWLCKTQRNEYRGQYIAEQAIGTIPGMDCNDVDVRNVM